MGKCAKCGKEVAHVHYCHHCKQTFCLSHSRHYRDHYFCEDCIKRYYTPPVRKKKEPKVEEKKPEKKPVPELPFKLEGDMKKFAPVVVVIMIVFMAAVFMIPKGGAAPVENVTNDTEVAVNISEEAPFSNKFPLMTNYLTVTNYSLECLEGSLSGINLELNAGGRRVRIYEVKVNDKKLKRWDWYVPVMSKNTYAWMRISNLLDYINVTKENGEEISVRMVANESIGQKVEFVPNFDFKCE